MKNTALPQSEVELVEKALKVVREIVDNHEKVTLDLMKLGADKFNRIHTTMYLDFLKDFLSSAKALESVMYLTEEELTERLAKDNVTLEEFEKKLMMKMLMDMVED